MELHTGLGSRPEDGRTHSKFRGGMEDGWSGGHQPRGGDPSSHHTGNWDQPSSAVPDLRPLRLIIPRSARSLVLFTRHEKMARTREGRALGRRSHAATEEEVKETLVDGAEISFAPVAKDHKKRRREGAAEKTERRGGLVPLQE